LGGRPIRARSEGGSSAPLEATRGRECGWPQRPERALAGESLSAILPSFTATNTLRSMVRVAGKEQLPVRNEMTKPGASSFIVILERTGPVCKRSKMEEHRTKGGADGLKRRRTFRAVNSSLTHSNNVDSNQLFNLFFFLIIIPSPFLIRLRGRI